MREPSSKNPPLEQYTPPRTPAMPAPSQPPAPPAEIGGPKGPEPTRYGDWEYNGRCTDF
ncbi:MAG TPA: DUF1674 domain-containing protein [Stellaceae bacterium]|nr:DUF1674 domain-containing protein [Stellaceae bacterium]